MDESKYRWIAYPGPLPAEGQAYSIHLNDTNLCLGRHGGAYYAVSDKCPHAGASLGEGTLNNIGDVVCPVHRITFNMATGKNTSPEGYGALTCYPVKVEGDTYFVGFPLKKNWFGFWK